MAIAEQKSTSDGKVWGFFKLPFKQSGNNSSGNNSSTTSSVYSHNSHQNHPPVEGSNHHGHSSSGAVSSVSMLFLPTRRRLKLDPHDKLYFPCEPGKQVRSAVKIKNISKSYAAFKFQTTAPKSCFMRPPGGVLAPGESIIATVFKFVEIPDKNEKLLDQKNKVKFKIMSLKVQESVEYVPELFDEQKDRVAIEQIFRVVFLDPERPSQALKKLNRQLAEAEAALEAQKKQTEDAGTQMIGEGLVIDEWKERREKYLARQQVDGVVDSSA